MYKVIFIILYFLRVDFITLRTDLLNKMGKKVKKFKDSIFNSVFIAIDLNEFWQSYGIWNFDNFLGMFK